MKFIERLSYLENIMNKYGIDEIEKLYKDNEVKHVINSFEKAKYSEPLKKKLIAKAKKEKITLAQKVYFNQILQNLCVLKEEAFLEEQKNALHDAFTKLRSEFDLENVNLKICFSHRYDKPERIWISLNQKDNNEVISFITKLDFSIVWSFLQKSKYITLQEKLDDIFIENEWIIGILEEYIHLKNYDIIRYLIQTEKLTDLPFEFEEIEGWIYEN
jgi:hypothetical protein